MRTEYDVIIVGGGIIGTSLLYTLSNFSSVKSVLLIEKRNDFGKGTSSNKSNAQTLHVGDIETNYTIEKVISTKAASEMILKYTSTLQKSQEEKLIKPVSKMVLGVGEEEYEIVEKRYDGKFLDIFPHIRKVSGKKIGRLEPMVVKGRDPDEKIICARDTNGWMVDFEALSKSFVAHVLHKDKLIRTALNEEVSKITERNGVYELISNKAKYRAKFVVFAAGGYSLYFAKSLGYGKDLSILSVDGHFYHSKQVLRGKVYRVQKGSIPFAAVHGDPDLAYPNKTRFGPTVNVVPYLERNATSSAYKYIEAMGMDAETVESLLKITTDRDILRILERNLIYSMPDFGKHFFVREEVNKIVPTLNPEDVTLQKDGGGIRPQIIDKRKRKLVLGVVDLKVDGLEFDMAPSPGASACLKEALDDTLLITEYLGEDFYKEKFSKIFCRSEKEKKLLFGDRR